MNKLISKIVGVCLGLSLATGVGVGVAMGQDIREAKATEEIAYKLDGTITGSGNSYTGNGTATQSSVDWIVNGNLTMNPWRLGTPKSGSAGTRVMQSQVAVSSQNITKVVVSSAKPSKNAITPTNVSLKVGTAIGGSTISSISNGSWDTTITFERPAGVDWSDRFFEIDFAMPSNSDTKNAKYIAFSSAIFYYEASAPVTYSVTYDGNNNTSGSVPVDGTAYSSGATVTVLGNVNNLARTDYLFDGWNTAANGSGTGYEAGDTFEIEANTTLYAQWKYNVHYTDDTTEHTITWNLAMAEQMTESEDEVTWESPKATMSVAKGEATTPANNYLPPHYNSTRFYQNSVLTIAPVNGYKIVSIVATATTDGYATAFAGSTFTNATATSSATVVTITPDSPVNSISATIGGTCGFTSIVVNYATVAALSSISLTGSMTKTSYCVGDNWNPAGFVVTATYADSSTSVVTDYVEWTYSPATIDSTSITGVIATASYTENGVTKTATSSEQVVTVASEKGVADNPYTVAEAIAAIDELGSGETLPNKYTYGIICRVDSYNTTYHSITYWISDDGSTTTMLEAYGGLGLESAAFSGKEDLMVGDMVTICGTLKLFNSTHEYDANNYLTSFERPTLSSISGIEGSLTVVLGATNWDLSVLTPKGSLSNGMTNMDISHLVTLSTSNIPGSTVGSKVVPVTVTPKAGSVSAETFNVSGEVINASGDLASGRYYLLNSDKTLGLSAEPCTNGSPTVVDLTEENELNAFDVALVGASTYEISTTVSGVKYYLVHNSTATSKANTSIRVTSNPESGLKTRYWVLDSEVADTEGAYSVSQNTVGDTIRHLACYNRQDWRGYMTADGDQDIQFVPEGYYAGVVAEMIINDLTCDNGVTPPNVSVWGDIATAYSEITIFNEMVLLVDGTADEESTDIIERALAKYDFVIGKYGTTNYTNFLTRSPSGANRNISIVGDDNSAAVTAIVVVMALTVTTAGAYFFLRKKKKEEK